MTISARDGSLLAGRVGRPHGLDGSFYVTSPRASLLHQGASVTLGGRPTRIVRRAGTDARPIVRVELAADRDGAERLRGEELHVAAGAAPPLGPDEYWPEQLEGCAVVDVGATAAGVDAATGAAGREVGTVRAMLALPSCECLRVERPDGSELLVPLVKDAIRSIDVERRVIEVNMAFLGE